MSDLELGEGEGNGSVDGNLHGGVTVLQQTCIVLQEHLQIFPG